jgi:hypothetical protein
MVTSGGVDPSVVSNPKKFRHFSDICPSDLGKIAEARDAQKNTKKRMTSMTLSRSFRLISFGGMCTVVLHLGACSTPAVRPQESPVSVQAAATVEPEIIAPDTLSNGFYTRGQASRGERRFQQLCADCHRTVEITRGWFGGTSHKTASDLLLVMSMTMPDSSPGSLSSEEYTDILAFLLRLNDYPAGEEELPTDLAALENIPIPAR